MRTNAKRNNKPIHTHEGGKAFSGLKPVEQLRRSVMSCLLWEHSFYEDGQDIAARIQEHADQCRPEDIVQTAFSARSDFNLRHAPLWLVLNAINRGEIKAAEISGVLQRADEPAELLAMFWKDGRKPLPAQLKKGLALALRQFDAYQIAKYRGEKNQVTLRDVVRLVHPAPVSEEQAAAFKQLIDGTLRQQGTWEDGLSAGGDKRQVWTGLLQEGKLGYMALLRNLRNMEQAGVDSQLIEDAILARKGAKRVLPFRYVAASLHAPRYANALNQALSEAMADIPRFSGETVVLVDVSGSMGQRLARKSDMSRMHAAAALGSLFPGRARVFSFSQRLVEVPAYGGLAGIDQIIGSQGHGGTYLAGAIRELNGVARLADRLVVITDEQSHDGVCDGVQEKLYMINVGTDRNGVGYGRWTHIDGFSENVFRWMREYEA